jgi:glycosyltransferase involved in cell wall biosynthesis
MKSGSKLVILTPGFAAGQYDTTAIPSLQLFLAALKRNSPALSIAIVTFQYPYMRQRYEWNGIPVFAAGGANGKLNRLLTWLCVYRELKRLHKEEGIGILHAFWLTEASLVGVLFAKMNRVPFLATAMGRDVKPGNHYLPLLRLFRFPLVLLSEFQRSFPGPRISSMVIRVIPFGVETTFFGTTEVAREIDILGVGSLNETKDYQTFIAVVRMVANRFPGLRCMVAGGGVLKARLEILIRETGLEGVIILAGELPYPETIRVMHKAKVLLHCAPFEGQALVITEALAAGAYVVCRPAGIAASLENMKLFTAGSPEGLTEKTIALLALPSPDHTGLFPITINDTCREYLNLYSAYHDTF